MKQTIDTLHTQIDTLHRQIDTFHRQIDTLHTQIDAACLRFTLNSLHLISKPSNSGIIQLGVNKTSSQLAPARSVMVCLKCLPAKVCTNSEPIQSEHITKTTRRTRRQKNLRTNTAITERPSYLPLHLLSIYRLICASGMGK